MVRKVGATHKKRTHKKATPKRRTTRRRISGANDISGMAMKVAGLGAGSIAARELNTLVVKFLPSLGGSPMLSGAMQIAAGLVLPKFVKGQFVNDMGMGMIANGVMVVVVSTGIISGTNDRVAYRLNGTSNLPVVSGRATRRINGTSNLPVVSGQAMVSGRSSSVRQGRTREFKTVLR